MYVFENIYAILCLILIFVIRKYALSLYSGIKSLILVNKAMDKFPIVKQDLVFGYRFMFPNTDKQSLLLRYPRCMFKRVWWFVPVLILKHPTAIKKVINAGIPKGYIYEKMFRNWLGDGLVVSSGEKWSTHRKLLHPMVHGNMLKEYSGIINSCVDIFIAKQKENSQTGKEDCLNAVYRFISDAAVKCFFSRDDNLQNENSFDLCNKLKSLFHALFEKLETPYMFPDYIFNLSPTGRQARKDMKILHNYADELINKRLQEILLNKNDSMRSKDDVLDTLIQGSGSDGKGLSHKEMRDEVYLILII